jgi:hypothetical protein
MPAMFGCPALATSLFLWLGRDTTNPQPGGYIQIPSAEKMGDHDAGRPVHSAFFAEWVGYHDCSTIDPAINARNVWVPHPRHVFVFVARVGYHKPPAGGPVHSAFFAEWTGYHDAYLKGRINKSSSTIAPKGTTVGRAVFPSTAEFACRLQNIAFHRRRISIGEPSGQSG